MNKYISDSLLNIEREFNTGGDTTLVVSTIDKMPARKWKTEDKKSTLKLEVSEAFWDNNTLEKIGIGVQNGDNDWIVIDWDQIDQYNLDTIELLLNKYMEQGLIAYPTRKGFHMWFKKPEGFNEFEKWTKRQTGITTFVGNEKVDFLPNGIINFGLKSAKTGKFEALWDIDNFNEGELQADCVNLLRQYNIRPVSLNDLKGLPTLPMVIYPLGKTSKNKLDMEGSRNQGLTSWVNKLNFYSPNLSMEENLGKLMRYINGVYLKDNPLSEEELNNITVYNNEGLTNEFYLNKGDKKVKKTAVKKGESYGKAFEANFGDIARTDKSEVNDIVEWVIDNVQLKLYDAVILFHKYDKWQTNPNILMNIINNAKKADHISTSQLKEIYTKIVWELQDRIARGEFHWEAKINKRPLWVDCKGKQIDPFDVWENGTLKIQEGLEDGIIIHNMDIDFNDIEMIARKFHNGEIEDLKDQFRRYIYNPVKGDSVRYNHIMTSLGYILMTGKKFTKQILMVYSEDADSGKSKLLEMIGSYFKESDIARSKLHEMNGAHGLQSLMNKAVNIGDDIDGNTKVNTEIPKSLASEMFMQANPKNLPATTALMPKLAFSMNTLPTAKHTDKGWIRRFNIVHWEKNYDVADIEIETNIIKRDFRLLVFWMILSRYQNVRAADFWTNPYTEIMEEYEFDNKSTNLQMFEETVRTLSTLNSKQLNGQHYTQIMALVEGAAPRSFKASGISNKQIAATMRAMGYEQKIRSGIRVWVRED